MQKKISFGRRSGSSFEVGSKSLGVAGSSLPETIAVVGGAVLGLGG